MTAPCRCRDLRRALLWLVRATTRARDAVLDAQSFLPDDTKWPEDTDFEALEKAHTEEQDSRDELCRSLRHARRLLLETRKPHNSKSQATSNDPFVALRLLAAAAKRYRVSENAVCLAMDEEAFQDDGDDPVFTAALEEQAEAVRVLHEALVVAGRAVRRQEQPNATEALSRIMAAFLAREESYTGKSIGVLRAENELSRVLRSVALEFGFGGEDGGSL